MVQIMPASPKAATGRKVAEEPREVMPPKVEKDRGVLDAAREQPPQATLPISVIPKVVDDLLPSFHSSTSSNRGRVVSLDRGQDLILGAEVHGRGGDDDDGNSTVTSDGESSYFAKHLPSPKSGHMYFTSDAGSIRSAPERTGHMHTSMSRESDASLSFSDDDDEEHEGKHIFPPSVPLPRNDLQFRGIARMHSASSLVSAEDRPRSSEFERNEAELQNVGTVRQMLDNNNRPHDNPGHSFYATQSPQPLHPSPPTILPQFPAMAGAIHPQPMNPGQMQAWMSAGNAAARLSLNSATDESKCSHGTLPLVYSEDDETVEVMASVVAGSGSGGRGIYRGELGGSNGQSLEGGPQDATPQGLPIPSAASRAGFVAAGGDGIDPASKEPEQAGQTPNGFTVYWRRWVMLFYMSLLNLLSDWTCYSVAPIARLTSEAFGSIDPEQLVVIFLVANAVASACEPIILARLGLRRTVIFGSLLLMIGSIIKSGGLPPILESNLQKGQGEWRVYLGFFLVGLSQPLYQCTPAMLSASWFPEKERTMATGVALNSNQLGIGCAFAFGTLLVSSSDDIVPYFGLLSTIATLAFIGTLLQFDDAPPTPPSDTAKVMRGTMEWRLPDGDAIWQSVRNFGASSGTMPRRQSGAGTMSRHQSGQSGAGFMPRSGSTGGADMASKIPATRRRPGAATRTHPSKDDGQSRAAPAPSSDPTKVAIDRERHVYDATKRLAPSPMMPGRVAPQSGQDASGMEELDPPYDDIEYTEGPAGQGMPPGAYPSHPQGALPYAAYPTMQPEGAPPYVVYPNMQPGQQYSPPPQQMPPYQQQYWAQQHYQQSYQQGVPMYGAPQQQPQEFGYYPPDPYYYPPQQYYPPQYPPHYYEYDEHNIAFAPPYCIEEYAEPTLTITDHHLDINIRDDQVLLSVKACMARRGFIHAVVAFAVSGIVINTLSTYMDYLVRLNGASREYVGIVGGSFQVVIMISSLIVGKQTDRTRAYYSVTIVMLVLGAFALAECGVSLDADRGGDLRWSLIVVAALVGPLQPVSTELGVEVAFPLSENTVLVIQQLFSNLLSAMFIPFFKALRDVGRERIDATDFYERPQYTFSFYLLIVLLATATVFFATFNGRYLRYEKELARQQREKREQEKAAMEAYEQKFEDRWNGHYQNEMENDGMYPNERTPLASNSEVI